MTRSARTLLAACLLAVSGENSAAGVPPSPSSAEPLAPAGSAEGPAPSAPPAPTPSTAENGAWRTEAQAGIEYESLSDGHGPWRGVVVEVSRHGSRHRALHLTARDTTRFSLRDRAVGAAATHPLGGRVTASGELEVSPSHRVLPAWALGARAGVRLPRGYAAHAGLRHRRYDGVTVNLLDGGAERYVGRYRLAYTAYLARLSGGETAASHAARLDRFYGRDESNLLGVGLAAGAELEHLGSGTILRTPVRALSLLGRHWFTPRWALVYGAGMHDQGALYTRRGGSVAVRYRF